MGLRIIINGLDDASTKHGMKINLEKTKITIITSGEDEVKI